MNTETELLYFWHFGYTARTSTDWYRLQELLLGNVEMSFMCITYKTRNYLHEEGVTPMP